LFEAALFGRSRGSGGAASLSRFKRNKQELLKARDHIFAIA
jgi:hypothetical protein